MNILTWNVNGLRAALRKGIGGWIRDQEVDLVCLQEIRTRPDQLSAENVTELAAYQACWSPAERAGYSGVATFFRQAPEKVQAGLGIEAFDHEGRAIISHHPGFVLFNLYVPNGQRDHSRVPYKLEFYAALLEIVKGLHAEGQCVILAGDFNTAHQEIDLRNPQTNAQTTGFLPAEREWIGRFLDQGLVDIFREQHPSREQYTWWSYRFGARERNIGWRLDYFLISANLVPRVRQVKIHDQVMGSDHCPVSLELG